MNEKHREVRAWLECKFAGENIPSYEISSKTIDELYELMQKNVRKDRDAQLVIDELRQASTEYTAEAQREGHILEQMGFTPGSLSQSGVISLRTLVSLALALKVSNTTDTQYLLALQELGDELFKVSEARKAEQRTAAQLLVKAKYAMVKSNKLKQALVGLDDQAVKLSREGKSKAKQGGFLISKAKEYKSSLQQFQNQLTKRGMEPSLYHRELVNKSEEIQAIQDKLLPLKSKLQTYQSLPPDISLTKVKIEELRHELSSSNIEPIVIPYLSPLVLRKELETVLDSEGDMALTDDSFVDDHPIIFWNLLWYLRRIELTSHLPGFVLTAKTLNPTAEKEKHRNSFNYKNVLIRPVWDNVRMQEEECGSPMYMDWNAGHQSTTVNALLTEGKSFSRHDMEQIVSSIQCGDIYTPMRIVMNTRRKIRRRGARFRSMYREILYLSFAACGRENIDHDAYDTEYKLAYNRLSPSEVRLLQEDDKPRPEKVIQCRRWFAELEL